VILNKYNIYLFSLGILLNLYVLNLFATINGIKIFNTVVPIVLMVYLYYLKIKLNNEVKLFVMLLMLIALNQVSSLFFNSDISVVLSFNIRWMVILIILIPLYGLYKKNYKLFDNMIILAILITTISNFYFYFYFFDHMSRFRGTFGNPNEFSLLLTFMTYFILYYIYIYNIKFKKNLIKKFFLISLLLSVNLLILITLSRSGIIILLIFYIFYYFAIRKEMNLLYKFILIFMIVGGLTLIYNNFTLEFELLFDRFTNSEGSVSSDTRYEQISAGINAIENNPYSLILGIGTGSTSDPIWFGQYFLVNSIDSIMRVHNSLFSLLLENGLIILVVYITLHILIFRKIFMLSSKFKYSLIGYLFAAFLYSQAAYIVYFFPYWLGLIMLSQHADRIKVKIKEKNKL